MPKTILFVCNEFPPFKHGGIGTFVKTIAEELTKHDFECIVVGIYPVKQTSIEINNKVVIHRIKSFQSSFLSRFRVLKLLKTLIDRFILHFAIRNLEKQKHIDLIESYDWTGPLILKPRSKMLIRLHGSNSAHALFEGKAINKFLYFFEKRNIKFADYIVSVSNHQLNISETAFSKIEQPKSIIYNSYNDQIFKPSNIERNLNSVLFVGKFHERKGVFELFEILNELLKINPSVIFTFVGSHTTENRNELINLLDSKNRDRIEFINVIPQSELAYYYSRSALLIMPSKAEAFGLTSIEAMACGCVVAMSDLPISKELIKDDFNGIIINIFNSIESSKKINDLLLDQVKLEQLRENAFKEIDRKFNPNRILQENISLYNSIE